MRHETPPAAPFDSNRAKAERKTDAFKFVKRPPFYPHPPKQGLRESTFRRTLWQA
jgi:hypothetical protein